MIRWACKIIILHDTDISDRDDTFYSLRADSIIVAICFVAGDLDCQDQCNLLPETLIVRISGGGCNGGFMSLTAKKKQGEIRLYVFNV